MPLPFAQDPATLPLHVVFPEAYEASKKRIVRDFAVFGVAIVTGVLALAILF